MLHMYIQFLCILIKFHLLMHAEPRPANDSAVCKPSLSTINYMMIKLTPIFVVVVVVCLFVSS